MAIPTLFTLSASSMYPVLYYPKFFSLTIKPIEIV